MKKIGRGDFIKKAVLGTLATATGVAALGVHSDSPELYPLNTPPKNYKDIDWNEIKKQFLYSAKGHYFNFAGLGLSTGAVSSVVCSSIEEFEKSGSHGHEKVAEVHSKIAAFLTCGETEISITRNATEGMNIIANSIDLKAGDEVILTKHEHVGGAMPWLALQKEKGIKIKLIELDLDGKKIISQFKSALSNKTRIVSFSHVTCTTGLILPVKEIAELCRNKGIYTSVDGAQAIGMIPLNMELMQPDFYTCSGHKWLMGPKGTGILYINKKILPICKPVFVGAYSDCGYNLNELNLEYKSSAQREEYGTRNTPLILGLGEAIDFINAIGLENIQKRELELTDYFRKRISKIKSLEILTPQSPELSAGILTIRFKEQDNAQINQKLMLDHNMRLRSIYENDLNAIRISFSIYNSVEEVDNLIKAIKSIN